MLASQHDLVPDGPAARGLPSVRETASRTTVGTEKACYRCQSGLKTKQQQLRVAGSGFDLKTGDPSFGVPKIARTQIY